MSSVSELREMSDEQLALSLKEAAESLFRLRLQAQTERLDAPSELRRYRCTIARIKTLQRERGIVGEYGSGVEGASGESETDSDST